MLLIVSKEKSSSVPMFDIVHRLLEFMLRRELLRTIKIILCRAELVSAKDSHLNVFESLRSKHQCDSAAY